MLDEAKNAAEFNDYLRNVVFKFYTQTNLPVPKLKLIKCTQMPLRNVLSSSIVQIPRVSIFMRHLPVLHVIEIAFYPRFRQSAFVKTDKNDFDHVEYRQVPDKKGSS